MRWNNLHPKWADELASRACKEYINIYAYLEGVGIKSKVDSISIPEIVHTGVVGVDDYTLEDGELVIEVNLNALLAHGWYDIICLWLEQSEFLYKNLSKKNLTLNVLKQFCKEPNTFGANIDVDMIINNQTEFNISPLLFLITGLKKKDEAAKLLNNLEQDSETEPINLIERAKVWHFLLGNIKRAKRLFSEYEYSDLMKLRIYTEVLYRPLKTKSILKSIESQSHLVNKLVIGAKIWKEVYYDREKALKCMNIADKESGDIDMIIFCAETWSSTFGDHSKVSECLVKTKRIIASDSDEKKYISARNKLQ